MNHYNLQLIANEQLATRRAEADRSRLAHSGDHQAATGRSRDRSRQPRRSNGLLGSLFHRVALF